MNALDINNLQGEYRTGKAMDDGSGVFVTPIARLSYQHLFERSASKNPITGERGTPYFNACFIFNCQNTSLPGLVDPFSVFWPYVEQAADRYFAEKKKSKPFNFPLNIRDGREKEGKDGYGAGYWFITAKNHNTTPGFRLPVVDGSLNLLSDGQIKSGDFVRARVAPYVPKTENGVFFELKSVQLILPWDGFGEGSDDTGNEWAPVPGAGQVPIPVAGRDW